MDLSGIKGLGGVPEVTPSPGPGHLGGSLAARRARLWGHVAHVDSPKPKPRSNREVKKAEVPRVAMTL